MSPESGHPPPDTESDYSTAIETATSLLHDGKEQAPAGKHEVNVPKGTQNDAIPSGPSTKTESGPPEPSQAGPEKPKPTPEVIKRDLPPDSPPRRDTEVDSGSDDDETKALRSQRIGRFQEDGEDPWTTFQTRTQGSDMTQSSEH